MFQMYIYKCISIFSMRVTTDVHIFLLIIIANSLTFNIQVIMTTSHDHIVVGIGLSKKIIETLKNTKTHPLFIGLTPGT